MTYTTPDPLNFIRRTGPHADRKPGPVHVLAVAESKEALLPMMRDLRALLLDSEVCHVVRDGGPIPLEHVEGYGFRGKPPRICFHDGPGKDSVITFQTCGSAGDRLQVAGAHYDLVVSPNPLKGRALDALTARLLVRRGQMWTILSADVLPRALQLVSRLHDIARGSTDPAVVAFLATTEREYADVFQEAEEHARETTSQAQR
jgi:hypothetical protein